MILKSARLPIPILCLFLLTTMLVPAARAAALSDFRYAVHEDRVYIAWRESGDFDSVRVAVKKSGGTEVESIIPYRNSAVDYYSRLHKDLPVKTWKLPAELPLTLESGLFVHCPEAAGLYEYRFTPCRGGKPVEAAAALKNVRVERPAGFSPHLTYHERDEAAFREKKPLEVVFHAIGGFMDDEEARKRAAGENLPVRSYLHWHNDGARMGIPNYFIMLEYDNRYQLLLDDLFRPDTGLFSRTWWFGYNEFVHEPEKMAQGRVYPYTHRRLEKTIAWASENYPVDRNRIYGHGASMGATGLMIFALTHPGLFSAVDARVPAFNLGRLIKEKRERTYPDIWGPPEAAIKYQDGTDLDEYLDLGRMLRRNPAAGYPFIRTYSGRTDLWMHWHFNPDFYRAMDEAGLTRLVTWSHLGHSGQVEKILGESGVVDFQSFYNDRPLVGFRNSNFAADPGDGKIGSGAPTGVIGRGFKAEVSEESPERLVLKFETDGEVTRIDLVPRRLQKFLIKPGQRFSGSIRLNNRDFWTGRLEADQNGLLFIPIDLSGLPENPGIPFKRRLVITITPAS
ncbi:MAG TPA: hypothetical protein PKM61_04180 [bacterium]|nr:hypothetical protein [bacterium]